MEREAMTLRLDRDTSIRLSIRSNRLDLPKSVVIRTLLVAWLNSGAPWPCSINPIGNTRNLADKE